MRGWVDLKMIRIFTLWITLIGISLGSNQNYFIINHLVEKNGKILKPFTNERVIGNIYRYFVNDNLKSENVFVGKITKNGKQGIWTRWWNNGQKKIQGHYINSVKYGIWTEWIENGEKYSEIFYNNGSIIYLKNCFKDNCD